MNTFPGLVHTARHVMKVGNTRSQWPNPCGRSCRRWDRRLGRSRNKVAVPEGAAGSPPFLGAPRETSPVGGGVSREEFGACSGCRLGAQQQSSRLRQQKLPAHYWVLRQHLCCPGLAGSGRVVSLHLGGGVWCLDNWIVVASILSKIAFLS